MVAPGLGVPPSPARMGDRGSGGQYSPGPPRAPSPSYSYSSHATSNAPAQAQHMHGHSGSVASSYAGPEYPGARPQLSVDVRSDPRDMQIRDHHYRDYRDSRDSRNDLRDPRDPRSDARSDVRSIDSRADSRSDKRLPSLPSPLAGMGRWALGAYDNRLVSSTLSQLPPLPPLSPGGGSVAGSQLSSSPHINAVGGGTPGSSPNFPLLMSPMPSSLPRTPGFGSSTHSLSPLSAFSGGAGIGVGPAPGVASMDAGVSPSAGILVLPDGTKLPNVDGVHQVSSQASHTGPNSPWSLLTVHVLPLFAGSPLKTPIEDLNSLCNQHIVVMSQRAPTSRLVSIFTNDLREFIASGMLTLKAKFEALEDAKVVSRTAEVWNFFWGQILPYVEGVFLPFSQVRDMPTTAASAAAAHQYAPIISLSPIPVRRILLSAFLVHILLPLLPRLMLLLSYRPDPKHRATDLPRLLQMSLVLSTQARYTTFHPARDMFEGEARDEHTRDAVEDLGRATRWSLAVLSGKLPLHEDDVYTEYTEYTEYAEYAHANSTPATAAGAQPATAVASTPVHPVHPGLQRGPSVSQAGRVRMRGNSVSNAAAQAREPSQSKRPPAWDGRIDEDDDELTHPRAFGSGGGGLGSTAHSTVRAAESFATLTERTPQGGADRMRTHAQGYSHGNSGQSHGLVHRRELSSGESDLTSASSIFRRKH